MIGTKSLITRLEKIKNAINNNVQNAVESETESAAKKAQGIYSTAQYVGDNDVVVTTNTPEHGVFEITASGRATLFIEFGTGILIPRTGEGLDIASEFPPGSWSAGHSKYLTDPDLLKKWHGYWPLPWGGGRLKTKGNPPANAMYYARKTLESTVPAVVRRELKRAFK